MLRRLSTTPCPSTTVPRDDTRRDSILSVASDTTANLDYTTEFNALLRNTKPTRRPTTAVNRKLPSVGFTIHEDEELQLGRFEGEGNAGRNTHQLPSGKSVMSQPAQRPKHRVSFVSPPQNDTVVLPPRPNPTFARAPRRASFHVSNPTISFVMADEQTLPHIPSPKISKPARRGTIYIPTDDTTMPSMYMGIFSPLKAGIAEETQEEASDITGLAAQMAKKRSSRKSILATSPKRVPLNMNTNPLQVTAIDELRPGKGPGKENRPPGHPAPQHNTTYKKSRNSILASHDPPRRASFAPKPSRLFEQTASSSARARPEQKLATAATKTAWNSQPKSLQPQPKANIVKPEPVSRRISVSCQSQQKPHALRVPTRFVVPDVKAATILEQYPLVPEGVFNASMYEESWLTQQEVAITQLVNNLFSAASPTFNEGHDDGLLRLKLLEHYGSVEMSLLHKRLQGALLYGALTLSKDAGARGHRLNNDLGHRRAFISLWLDTYDHSTLRTALEVVVGRLVGSRDGQYSGQRSSSRPSTINRKALHRAIEAFLIRNEDLKADSDANETGSWGFQRTVLRSLMLIKLLDEVKTKKDLPSTPSLFQASSTYKTSTSVVQRLISTLNPGVGDPLRPLHHLGYTVSHCQYPLEEYEYEVQNLAIDLRDGVRITRLVELLLYRSSSHVLEHSRDADATTTLAIPSGETLSLTGGNQDWPLSQHLKLPCLGRATKLYNTQIALSALSNVHGMRSLFQDISADDLVDGYREKTVRLLWALTSKWGLSGLVDWEDLKMEIKRLGRSQGKLGDWVDGNLDLDDEDPGYMRYKTLLKAWTKAVASSRGLVVRNFTTSFADGRLFEAIVDEYEPYLLGMSVANTKSSLSGKIKELGCSEQFVQLFEKSAGRGHEHIFDRDFVLASLAFLCSRLLGPSRKARGAVIIQRKWRRHWEQVVQARKSALQTLAVSCATKVQIEAARRQAKATIWRTWRSYRTRKDLEATAKEISDHKLQESSKDEEDIWLSLK